MGRRGYPALLDYTDAHPLDSSVRVPTGCLDTLGPMLDSTHRMALGALLMLGLTPAQGAVFIDVVITNQSDGRVFDAIVAMPEAPSTILAGLCLIHGMGTWEDQAVRWLPLAESLANVGFVSAYPDVRGNPERGASDCLAVADWLQEDGFGPVECVGIVAGSLGDGVAKATVQLYPDVFSAHVDFYGVVSHPGWDPTPPHLVEAITAPTLMQVGEADSFLPMMRDWNAWVERHNPDLCHDLRIYPGGHGFIFRDEPGAWLARAEMIEFLDWVLRDGNEPQWYQGCSE